MKFEFLFVLKNAWNKIPVGPFAALFLQVVLAPFELHDEALDELDTGGLTPRLQLEGISILG